MNSQAPIGILAFVISLGIFFMYVSPTWSGSIAETKMNIDSNNKALAAAQSFAKHQAELSEAEQAMNPADLSRVMVLLPDSVDNIGLIIDLNALAAKSGLSISNISVDSNSGDSSAEASAAFTSSLQSIGVSLSAVGSYSALKTFLQGVEKSQRLLDIQDLSVQGSDTGVYTYTMKIRIYWLR